MPRSVLLLLLLALPACDSSSDERDIAETDPDGTVVSDDPDDWQPRCADEPSAFCANPAYPNPIASTGTLTLEFATPVAQDVEVRIGEGTLVSRTFEPGLHRIPVEVSRFSLGFIRVEIEPETEGAQIEGDIQIVEG